MSPFFTVAFGLVASARVYNRRLAVLLGRILPPPLIESTLIEFIARGFGNQRHPCRTG